MTTAAAADLPDTFSDELASRVAKVTQELGFAPRWTWTLHRKNADGSESPAGKFDGLDVDFPALLRNAPTGNYVARLTCKGKRGCVHLEEIPHDAALVAAFAERPAPAAAPAPQAAPTAAPQDALAALIRASEDRANRAEDRAHELMMKMLERSHEPQGITAKDLLPLLTQQRSPVGEMIDALGKLRRTAADMMPDGDDEPAAAVPAGFDLNSFLGALASRFLTPPQPTPTPAPRRLPQPATAPAQPNSPPPPPATVAPTSSATRDTATERASAGGAPSNAASAQQEGDEIPAEHVAALAALIPAAAAKKGGDVELASLVISVLAPHWRDNPEEHNAFTMRHPGAFAEEVIRRSGLAAHADFIRSTEQAIRAIALTPEFVEALKAGASPEEEAEDKEEPTK